MSTSTKKKKVKKLTGNNGGKEKPTVRVSISIKAMSDGQIKIWGPKNLALFRAVLIQAERIMEENYGDLPENQGLEKKERKVIELNPRIEIARR